MGLSQVWLSFGSLGIGNREQIVSNAKENNHSALAYANDIDAFFDKELKD